MITLTAIIVFILFLKIVGFVFDARLRVLGWLISGAGFIISVFLSVSVIGIVFNVLPTLLIIGVLLLVGAPANIIVNDLMKCLYPDCIGCQEVAKEAVIPPSS